MLFIRFTYCKNVSQLFILLKNIISRESKTMKTTKLVLILALTFFISSCTYLEDRRQDLTDMANVNVSAFSIGLGVNAGPAIAGYHKIEGLMGGSGARGKLGLGGVQDNKERGDYYGVGLPLSWAENKDHKDSFYKKHSPAWTSVGFDLGLIFGVGARADALEALDFVLGLFLIDILDDDRAVEEEYQEEENNLEECTTSIH
jgi:hypothetical protein